MKHHQGFTLLELMITIAILAILVAIATPSMRHMIYQSQVASQVRDLSSFIQEVRSKAVIERRPYTLNINTGTASGSSAITGNVGTWESNTDVQISNTPSSLTFSLLGTVNANEACYAVSHAKDAQIAQVLIISQNGNAKVFTDKTACP